MSNRKILAIDPGDNHTAIALYDELSKDFKIWIIERSKTMEKYYDTIKETINIPNIDIFIIEDFKLYHHKACYQLGHTMKTSELIGKLEVWAELFKFKKIIRQDARNAKSIKETNDIFKEVLKTFKRTNRHQRDAIRHILYFLARERYDKTRII